MHTDQGVDPPLQEPADQLVIAFVLALGGAIIGTYPIYAIRVEIPALDLCMQCYIVIQSREKSNAV